MTFNIIFSLYWVLQNAVLGRADGSSLLDLKNWVEKSLITLYFVLASAPHAGVWGLLSAAGMAGVATGHGQYLPAMSAVRVTPEKLDFVLLPFFGKDPRATGYVNTTTGAEQMSVAKKQMGEYGMTKLYWRCVAGMFVTGSVVGLPAAGIAVAFDEWVAAGAFSMTGVAKAISYMIGNKFFGKNDDAGSVAAEWVNGGLRGLITLVGLA